MSEVSLIMQNLFVCKVHAGCAILVLHCYFVCTILYIFVHMSSLILGWTGVNERTFIAVKPDGVQRKLVGEIVRRFEKRGFKLVGLKLVKVCGM